ncbi:hypothetical protein ASPZODRAFT_1235397 [Penicilliopsis zonata CBS 506.65]|uniref:Cyanovirin-N domain-containing protein n=1 Tax=Penicilliopsis zonata CBS 506.65 TaxID=1073090 RepID=A0A1L9S6U2_9EURO|nr:hypothetical protein ASPZODRAFT_1235397 [Penicilliopsis zonata CBS 506.65]OJJ42896.1 hypothetical protein ASPZODRAFT_1235397 [Penicilliopsis zonata CBS 506.65]
MSPRRSMKQCILLFALCIIGILAKECGTVSQCELGCIDGLFYERNTPGTQTFVCSTSRRKSRNDWYIGYCGEFDATTFACASLSGELRCNKCMFEHRDGGGVLALEPDGKERSYGEADVCDAGGRSVIAGKHERAGRIIFRLRRSNRHLNTTFLSVGSWMYMNFLFIANISIDLSILMPGLTSP